MGTLASFSFDFFSGFSNFSHNENLSFSFYIKKDKHFFEKERGHLSLKWVFLREVKCEDFPRGCRANHPWQHFTKNIQLQTKRAMSGRQQDQGQKQEWKGEG